jgi:TonB family protein
LGASHRGSIVLLGETFFRGGKTMFFSGPRFSWLALLLSFTTCLTPLSPATPNVLPAQASLAPPALASQQQSQLHDLAVRVLQHADRAGCKKGSCTILVGNFTDSSGSTSILGTQLADAVSEQLAAVTADIQVADRKRLYEYLERERIPSKALAEDNAERWLAMEQSANAVLIGRLDGDGDKLTVTVQLLDAHYLVRGFIGHRKVLKGPQEKVELTTTGTDEQFRKPAEPFREASASQVAEDQGIPRAGVHGVTAPSGVYTPSPSYTDFARTAKIQGMIILLITVSVEGRAENLEVLKGLPFGLNQAALNVVRTWKFRPSTLEGRPIAAKVPIEVTFRLY